MMHNFPYEEHNRSKTRALHPEIKVKIYLEPKFANLVIKNNKSYTNWHNCSSHGHNIEYNRQFLSIAQKHNR